MVRELMAQGMTLAAIGERVGLAKSSLSELAAGLKQEPRGTAAILLYRLHGRRCGRRNGRARP